MDVQNKEDRCINSVISIAKKQEQGGYGSCCYIPLCTHLRVSEGISRKTLVPGSVPCF